jgi:FMN-dependent oxidoreductase (nitrilotriacetate monooxygenase family)
MQSEHARQMVLVAFLQAQNCSILTSSWRHPETVDGFLDSSYFQQLAQTLESGRFHLAFFDDRLAMPDTYGSDHSDAVREGIRPVKLDPIPLLAYMGAATERLGLGATYSTTYHEPYHVARVFQTLDHMTGGRAAWNVVTSLNNSEAANFGHSEHLPHDTRYDRADEFLEVVLGHWNSWSDDALVIDRTRGVFADPTKVTRLDYSGKFIKSRGPFTVPRSPQGHPVIIQAGQSGRGSTYAAKWGDLIFCIFHNLENGKDSYKKYKKLVADSGRDPSEVKIIPAFFVVVGETRAMAEDKLAVIESLTRPLDGIVLLSEQIAFDFSKKPLDDPFSDEELKSVNGIQALRDRVLAKSGKSNPSTRDFITYSAKSTVHELPLLYGTPTEIADQMEQWFAEEACDGFVIPATHLPGTYEDFSRLVSPELQRRGLLHVDYAGRTLRENLGLPFPNVRTDLRNANASGIAQA